MYLDHQMVNIHIIMQIKLHLMTKCRLLNRHILSLLSFQVEHNKATHMLFSIIHQVYMCLKAQNLRFLYFYLYLIVSFQVLNHLYNKINTDELY